ncbi:RNA 3'-terminal phosphate cyclase [Nevskia sp.]|uniref:RNA 3'-terminal phosphate cyclase n=1 Tax=Nevskia sp. TaxID=1929292 RepID=UPI0025EA9171|nr:RNA 3'-terminal phosphate cyclase [Nevskia sp.]
MLELDGSGGGGQLLRSALALSLCSGEPFRMRGIRAGRPKPGLMRQHLTAVEAAVAISGSTAIGAAPGSQQLEFRPGAVRGGDHRFAIGTAGSTTLVLQTVLPALLRADRPSTLIIEGGTHNPLAPTAEFLIQSFAPLLRRMGAELDIRLLRHGFFPAGGGALRVSVTPSVLRPLNLEARGAIRAITALAISSALADSVGERELAVVGGHFGLPADALVHQIVERPVGPGNALLITVESEAHCAVFAGFGERRMRAEQVAAEACQQAQRYLDAGVAVDEHLADQLLLPMALAGGGAFTTTLPSAHFSSNAALIEKFLPVEITQATVSDNAWRIDVLP